MNAFKKQCIELRKQDFTLPEIMKKTGRAKTSVYFHVKNIPLSTSKQKEIRAARIQRAYKAAEERKGKSGRSFKMFKTWDAHAVLLVAHLMFDGEITRTTCGYSNRSAALIQRVETLFRHIYDYEPKRHQNTMTGVRYIRHHNVSLAEYINTQSRALRSEIIQLPMACQREFIRAFFDDEGCMDVRLKDNRRRIRGYQKDRAMLLVIQKLLKNFEIESTLQGKNEIVITGKENLLQFQKEINFSEGVRMNGNRSNSIWKRHMKKRVLLDRAIRSFKT